LAPQQTAPFDAFRGARLTVTAEESAHRGQVGRVVRVFWRVGAPWVLMRSQRGLACAVPWSATDLPTPVTTFGSGDGAAPLLSPAALQALVRFVCQRLDRQTGGRSRR
jgi:hypothetical protein